MAGETPSTNGKPLTAKQADAEVQKMMATMALKVTGKLKQKSLPNDEKFKGEFPRLWAWVTATQIGQAMEKDAARIVFSVEDSTWKATLSDNALRCSLTGVGVTFEHALGNLESLMGDAEAPWVTWKQRGKALRDIPPQEDK
jgi:hypothetical protein